MSEVGWTGRERRRKTPWRTRVTEFVMRALITAGGFGTIATVILIFAFLLLVVFPLFRSGTTSTPTTVVERTTEPPLYFAADELKCLRLTLNRDGVARLRRADGSLVWQRPLFDGKRPTCFAKDPGSSNFAFGFDDGTVRQGVIRFATRFLTREDAKAFADRAGTNTDLGTLLPHAEGALLVTHNGDMRLQFLDVHIEPPNKLADAAISKIDISLTTRGPVFAALSTDGILALYETTEEMDMMSGDTVRSVDRFALPYAESVDDPDDMPFGLYLDGAATTLSVLWSNGRLIRFDARREALARAEVRRVLTSGAVTSATWLIGKSTLLVGDSYGGVGAWFLVREDSDAENLPPMGSDAQALIQGHEFGDDDITAPVIHLSPSARARFVVIAHGDGTLRVAHVTSEHELARTTLEGNAPCLALATTPKDDAIIALGPDTSYTWLFDAGHPEATFATLFAPVWYEGYAEPTHVWQSSGGDGFEPKFGMWPLIFGTLKATLYAMLFAAPLALLAAVFTSQFLSSRVRAPIKTAVEMMAGLPSVVLGFIAALVIAPYIQTVLPGTLLTFVLVPFTLLWGARLWQFFPQRVTQTGAGGARFALIGLAVVLGVLVSAWVGPALGQWCFDGDLVEWLGKNDRKGGVLAWAFFALPLAALVTVFVMSTAIGPLFRRMTHSYTWDECANADLFRFCGGAAVTIVTSLLCGLALHLLLGDPRAALLHGYAQKNALIVGFVMGFAVIPIVFTLADDALCSVPKQLKEGSLGAGATQWQTTWRVMLPAAMSGLFGAMMVGLGRAVGETMIVLMAAGNSPIMDLNMFNGFRTLAANIAVELPEAVKDSTHYRTLFLAALVLFAMTFLINTIAEVVRKRFRRRFAQL